MAVKNTDNLSHLAHQVLVPEMVGRYEYDDYIIQELQRDGSWDLLGRQYAGPGAWGRARHNFLRFFNEDRRKVRLMGRVYQPRS